MLPGAFQLVTKMWEPMAFIITGHKPGMTHLETPAFNMCKCIKFWELWRRERFSSNNSFYFNIASEDLEHSCRLLYGAYCMCPGNLWWLYSFHFMERRRLAIMLNILIVCIEGFTWVLNNTDVRKWWHIMFIFWGQNYSFYVMWLLTNSLTVLVRWASESSAQLFLWDCPFLNKEVSLPSLQSSHNI